MIAAYQILNKILQNKDYEIIKQNGLEASQFSIYAEQFQFIVDHYKKNGNIPDILTFQSYYPDFIFNEVYETDDYLLDRLYEENGYQRWTEILPTLNQKIKEDSRAAYEYMKNQMGSLLKPHRSYKGYDIIANAMDRYNAYLEKQKCFAKTVISSGLLELDDILDGGWNLGEELVVLTGRTGEGKSWVVDSFLTSAWKQEKRVCLYSGEMRENKVGYRFDSLYKHLSNTHLNRGAQLDGYSDYIESLKSNKIPFFVLTPKDFGGRPSVTELQSFCERENIDLLAIDQLSLMRDGRATKSDLIRIQYGHIAEDLFQLSLECKIPVLLLAQANRDSLKKNAQDAPGLENIKESDDIAHNASKVIGIRQDKKLGNLIIDVQKNRNGISGGKLVYAWDIDRGILTYNPVQTDAASAEARNNANMENTQTFNNITDINPF